MNIYLLTSAVVLVSVAAVHSILGEIRIFFRLQRNDPLPEFSGFPLLRKAPGSMLRTLRFVWHVATVFGLALAAMLLELAAAPVQARATLIICLGLSGAAVITFVISRGNHVGWFFFLLSAVLAFMGWLHPSG